MFKKEAILVGWVNHHKKADCGETVKNQLIASRLEELGWKVHVMDFKNWKKHPWIFLQFFFALLMHPKALLILSSSAENIYPIIKGLYFFGSKRKILHWVIGGLFHNKVKDGIYDVKYINWISANFVESPLMCSTLQSLGVDNVRVVPNFKPIDYLPQLLEKGGSVKRFVFVSRIMPEKGCDYILQAIKKLDDAGLTSKFLVHFYGKIAPDYEGEFVNSINQLPNAQYKGFLNFNEEAGYDTLAKYDAMLFPTYWKGEGFAGIFIDAYIAGTPILASDWGHNKTLLKEGETAIFYPVHDVDGLANVMRDCIEGKYDLDKMSKACQNMAENYDIRKIVTDDLLLKLK